MNELKGKEAEEFIENVEMVIKDLEENPKPDVTITHF